WAKNLKVTTGKNKVNRTNEAVVYVGDKNNEKNDRTLTTPETAQTYRVDVSELGGMYAERIQLVDNGTGLGVRNAGHIGASVGEVQIDSQGRIVNQGQVQAKQQIGITSDDNIDNRVAAKVVSQENHIQLKSKQTINQSGVVATRAAVKINARSIEQTKQGEILGENIHIEAKETLVNRGLINGRGTEDKSASTVIKASKITNLGTGRIYSDHLAFGAEQLENFDEQEEQLSSAVIAARKRLDLGVNHILNQSRYYTGDTDTASTIMSLGSLNIGKALDSQNNLIGQADWLYNRSALIQAEEGSWNVAQVHNINDFFQTEMREVSNKAVNWRYIVPEGWAESEHRIDGSLMRMESGVRGKSWNVFYRAPKREDIEKPANGDVLSNFLPEVNLCPSGECELRAAEYYFPNDPVWRAFAINTQQSDAVLEQLSQAKVPIAPVAPVEPREPQRTDFKGRQAQKRYENALEKYQQAFSDYQKEKSAYTLAYANYQQEKQAFDEKIKPLYFKWVKDNHTQFVQLKDKITEHNNFLYSERGKKYERFWVMQIKNQLIKADTVTQSQPGKIVFSGNLGVNATRFINDKSQIFLGETLHLVNSDVENLNVDGQQITQNIGERYYSYLKKRKSKTKSGRTKYRRTETSRVSGLLSTQVQSIRLPVANLYEQYDFTLDPVGKIDTGNQGILPSSSLYKINPDSANNVLIEIDPQFTDRRKWLSSDYMFNALRTAPQNILKRLGDGYYEQQLVRNQLNQLTGRAFTFDGKNFEDTYKILMNNGVQVAKQFDLKPGIKLTPEQVKLLTSDIVWFETKEIKLSDGSIQKVLAPQVYLISGRENQGKKQGATIHANHIVMNTAGDLLNQGNLVANEGLVIQARNINNQGGVIKGERVQLNALENLNNLGGDMLAQNALFATAGKTLALTSTATTAEVKGKGYTHKQTTLDKQAKVQIQGETGTLFLSGENVHLNSAKIANDGKGLTQINATNTLALNQVQTAQLIHQGGSGNHRKIEKLTNGEVAQIHTQGELYFTGRNIVAEGAEIRSQSNVLIAAEENVELQGHQKALSLEEYHKVSQRGLLSKSQDERYLNAKVTQDIGNQLSAKNVRISAGEHLTAKGVFVEAVENALLLAGESLTLNEGKTVRQVTQWQKHKKSGITGSLSGGVAAVGYSKEKEQQKHSSYDEKVKGTQIKTQQGDVILQAGEALNAKAVAIDSGNDTLLQSKQVNISTAEELHRSQADYERKASGIGINVVYDPLTVGRNKYQSRKDSGVADSVVGDEISRAESITDTVEMALRGVSPYLKHQRNEAHKTTEQRLAQTAQLNTQGKLRVVATEGDITTQGSQINAEKGAEFIASGSVNFDVATDFYAQNAEKRARGVELNGLNKYVAGLGVSREDGTQTRREERGTLITTGGDTQVVAGGDIQGKGVALINEGDTRFSAQGDIRLDTAKTQYQQSQNAKSHSIGEVATSDTERFFGYHRERNNQAGENTQHQGSRIVSLQGDILMNAGKDYQQTSSSLLAKNALDITAQHIYADTAQSTDQQSQSQSDLKIGQFSRIKSPIIDLIQTVERTVKNKNASDRVKAANAVTLAAQGYQLADTVMKTFAQQDGLAYLIRAESGTGVAHSRQSQEREAQLSQGNLFNGKTLNFAATGTGETFANGEQKLGDIHLTQSELTSRDEQGNRLAESHIQLTGNNIQLDAGKSHIKEKMRGQNVGVEVGMFAQAGPQTGVGVYATVGGGSQKMDAERTTYHNSHLDSEQITFNTQNNLTLQGATAKASRIDANVGGKLHIESLQDMQTLKSKSSQAGLSVSISFGNAWGANLGLSADRASENYRQVSEQSGLFAEEGGYHINANQVHLKGGSIASQNANHSELATNHLTAEDIQNRSSSQAMSGGASFGISHQEGHFEEKGTGKVVKNPEASNLDTSNLKWVKESTSPSLNTGIPMYESHHDSSVTKSTITAGKITLNKDSQPIHSTVEALAKTLNINTALDEANQQVEKPRDTQSQLQEQKIIRDGVGNLQSAMTTYTANQAKAAELEAERLEQDIAREQAKPAAEQDSQKLQQKNTALLKARETQTQWSEGNYKRTLDTATTIASGLLAGQSGTQIATSLASPYLNQQIKRFTTDEKGEVNLLTNTIAHAVLGAVEAAAAKGDITAGAISASASELAAPVFTQLLGKTHADQLNSDERQTVIALSSLVGALTAGLDAQQTGSGNNTVGILNAASLGGEIGKRAVENNYLSPKDVQAFYKDLEQAIKEGKNVDEVYDYYSKLSQQQRDELLAECDATCRLTVKNAINSSTELAYTKADLLSGWLWLSGLSSEERSRFLMLVENENNQTISALNEQQTLFEKGLELGLDTARFLRREEGLTPSNQHSFAKKAKNPNINNKDWKYIPAPKKEEITGFKDLINAKMKTPVQGGGKRRERWKDREGNIYEWDSQHGTMEKYNKRGKHLGEFDFKTGKQIKSADPTRRIEP
ncbi:colicin E3/pyocin S6 family cytotoxin, partial [Avibacterium paragallinarum]